MLLILADIVYLLLLVAVSPWLLWRAVFRGKYRRYTGERFGAVPRRAPDARPLVWIHAVSVGEVMAVRPLLQALQARMPDYDVGISAGTETGRDTAARAFPDHPTFQFPLDFSWAVRRALRRLQPAAVLLVELEVWPNFMRLCRARRVPVFVVNGRMSERSAPGYRRFRWAIGWMFRTLRLALVQTPAYADRFEAAGTPAERIRVVGTVKYDALTLDPDTAAAQRATVRQWLGAADDELVLVAGSTHPPEHEAVVGAWQTLRTEGVPLRLVLVPRHPERPDPMRYLERESIPVVRQSNLDTAPPAADAVVFGDVVGTLVQLYAAADIAFVGKSLLSGKAGGGHNILEPAALGIPVLHGPSMRAFAEPAADLLAREAAIQVTNEATLTAALRDLAADADRRRTMGEAGRAAVEAGRGASARTADAIAEALGVPTVSD